MASYGCYVKVCVVTRAASKLQAIHDDSEKRSNESSSRSGLSIEHDLRANASRLHDAQSKIQTGDARSVPTHTDNGIDDRQARQRRASLSIRPYAMRMRLQNTSPPERGGK